MLGLNPLTMAPRERSSGLAADYGAPVRERRFSPYVDNHGSVVAIAGADFVVVASDTRLSGSGYSILTREQPKLFGLSESTVLASTGCWCDVLSFARLASARSKMYSLTHGGDLMTTKAYAQMIATMLYGKRFFPYYISNILAGLDSETGRGVIYSYDPVGHMEKCNYRAGGSSVSLLQPLLDNQVGKKNMVGAEEKDIGLEEACNLVHDLFISACEREIHTGDSIALRIITKDGIKERTVALRRD